MDGTIGLILGGIVLAVMVWVVPRFLGTNTVNCTRCRGSGQVAEHWPDPSKPGGWHHVEGECPKCKGKGRVRI
jgi:hypothetical protein